MAYHLTYRSSDAIIAFNINEDDICNGFCVSKEKGILLFYLDHAAAADNSWTRTIDRSAVRCAVATGKALVYHVIPTGFNVIWQLPRVRNSTAMFMPITPLGVANIGVQDVSSIVIENVYSDRANVGTLVRRDFPSPSYVRKTEEINNGRLSFDLPVYAMAISEPDCCVVAFCGNLTTICSIQFIDLERYDVFTHIERVLMRRDIQYHK